MNCPNCGKELVNGAAFCTSCGTKIPQGAPAPAPAPVQQPTYQQPVYQQPTVVVQQRSPEDDPVYRPIGMWGYFGYEILFSIPCIGFICLLIMSFAATNKNVKNFARSYFCFLIIAVILVLLFLFVFGGASILEEMM